MEPFIHLTADGIDYHENGFSNAPTHPTIYNTTFEREISGPVQVGGSHNTQETSMRGRDARVPFGRAHVLIDPSSQVWGM